jgi:hypothetical protein
MTTMKSGPTGQPGEVEKAEIERPVPGPRDLLMRIRACGICGTDANETSGEVHPRIVAAGHPTGSRYASADHGTGMPVASAGPAAGAPEPTVSASAIPPLGSRRRDGFAPHAGTRLNSPASLGHGPAAEPGPSRLHPSSGRRHHEPSSTRLGPNGRPEVAGDT